jgi:hypothetical protein
MLGFPRLSVLISLRSARSTGCVIAKCKAQPASMILSWYLPEFGVHGYQDAASLLDRVICQSRGRRLCDKPLPSALARSDIDA